MLQDEQMLAQGRGGVWGKEAARAMTGQEVCSGMIRQAAVGKEDAGTGR